MDISFFLLFASWAQMVAAFWRLPCMYQTGIARIDPLVAPGALSQHAHTIHGGRNFGVDSDLQHLLESNCTSCAIDKDLSVYWTPPLYFKHANGTVVMVQQVGGMLAYYFNNNGAPGEKIHAFPPGFQMISGDARQRNFTLPLPIPDRSLWTANDMTQLALQQKSLGFNCLRYENHPEDALIRFGLPDKVVIDTCYSGLRLEIQFPSCWNGQDIDSPNHRDHVQFPNGLKTGECPEGFQTRLPVLFYETIYAVAEFSNLPGQYMLANGDTTGFGYHGDFINGWDQPMLQNALDTCTDESLGAGEVEMCPVFMGHISRKKLDDCKLVLPEKLVDENVKEPGDMLPGNVTISPGPAYAPKPIAEPLDGHSLASSSDSQLSTPPAPTMEPTTASDGRFTRTSLVGVSRFMTTGSVVEMITMVEEIVIPVTTTMIIQPVRRRHGHAGGHPV